MVTARCDNALEGPVPADCQFMAESSGWTVDEAWSAAKEQGWHRNGNRTICPQCWDAGAR
jgi:hypothetical protein